MAHLALLVSRGFHLLETHSKCLLFCALAWFALKNLLFTREQGADWELEPSWPSHELNTKSLKLHPGKLYSALWWNTIPNGLLLWKTLAFLPPRLLLCITRCSPSISQGSLGSACVKGVSMVWNSVQTHSLVCINLIWLANALFSQVRKSQI